MADGYLKPKLRGRSENFVSAVRTLEVPQPLLAMSSLRLRIEIAPVLERLDHVASVIVNPNPDTMSSACKTAHTQLHSRSHSIRHTTADRMAARRKLDRKPRLS